MPAVLARRDEIIHDLDDSVQLPWLEDRDIALVRGVGELTGERRVRVGDEELEATRAVILSTGSLPSMPPIEGLDAIDDAWTNRDATTAKEIPERLVIMGGGVVGVEMSQAFQTLGSQVTLIEGERRLLPREEEYACAQVTEALEEYGVDVRTGQKAERRSSSAATTSWCTTVRRPRGGGRRRCWWRSAASRRPRGSGSRRSGSTPTGRSPSTSACGSTATRGSTRSATSTARRCSPTWASTRPAIAADHIHGHDTAISHGADGALSPRVIFTEPQVAAVGHTTDTAAEAGLDVQVVETSTSGNAGGSFYGRNAPGTSRLLIDRERRVVVGATITGAEVGEMLHAATIAIVGEIPLERLRHAVPCFPTRSEIWLSLLADAGV